MTHFQQTEVTASSTTTRDEAMAVHTVMLNQSAYAIMVIIDVVLLCYMD